jgi:O-acetyl-ADP-ribose deacetylase (regulator of RNase III)
MAKRTFWRTATAIASPSFQVAAFSRIVFPAISTGAYGYPPAQAAHIAVTICARHPMARDADIVFAVIDPQNRTAIGAALNAIR